MAITPLSIKRFRILFFISWLALALVQFWMLNWYGINWLTALTDSLICNILLMAASLLLMTMLQYYLPRQGGILNLLIWIIVLSIIWLTITRLLLYLFLNTAEYGSFLKRSIPVRIGTAVLVLGWVAMTSMIWFSREEQKETDKRKEEAQQLAKEAELFKLRQQLQPHFLFNSLNSINALIVSQPLLARKMIQQLSDFLRGSLKKDDQQFISLQEELNYLDLYLEIEKVRFGHRLSTELFVAENTLTKKIPAFLLQPVVENAIKFGLYDTTGEIVISISAKEKDNDLEIIVQNPFDATTATTQTGTGFGLSSVKKRLSILFARNDLLTTTAIETIFTTKLIVPQS
jgi:two-component system, LytTR family, sensor kinase